MELKKLFLQLETAVIMYLETFIAGSNLCLRNQCYK